MPSKERVSNTSQGLWQPISSSDTDTEFLVPCFIFLSPATIKRDISVMMFCSSHLRKGRAPYAFPDAMSAAWDANLKAGSLTWEVKHCAWTKACWHFCTRKGKMTRFECSRASLFLVFPSRTFLAFIKKQIGDKSVSLLCGFRIKDAQNTWSVMFFWDRRLLSSPIMRQATSVIWSCIQLLASSLRWKLSAK